MTKNTGIRKDGPVGKAHARRACRPEFGLLAPAWKTSVVATLACNYSAGEAKIGGVWGSLANQFSQVNESQI